jgi:hypothetical protein
MRAERLSTVAVLLVASCLESCATLPNLPRQPADTGPEPRWRLEELSGLVQPVAEVPPDGTTPGADVEQEVELEVRVLSVDPTCTKRAFFAGAPGDRLTAGRLTKLDREAFVTALRESGAGVELQSQPSLRTRSGQPAPLHLPGLIGLVSTTHSCWPIWKPSTTHLEFRPLSRGGGAMTLEVRATLGRAKLGPPATRNWDRVEYETTISDAIRVRCDSGETLVVGGLRQALKWPRTAPVPLLSSLPVVGDRFSFTADESYEEELVVVITPRAVAPTAPK